jgi:hypothetical protein
MIGVINFVSIVLVIEHHYRFRNQLPMDVWVLYIDLIVYSQKKTLIVSFRTKLVKWSDQNASGFI